MAASRSDPAAFRSTSVDAIATSLVSITPFASRSVAPKREKRSAPGVSAWSAATPALFSTPPRPDVAVTIVRTSWEAGDGAVGDVDAGPPLRRPQRLLHLQPLALEREGAVELAGDGAGRPGESHQPRGVDAGTLACHSKAGTAPSASCMLPVVAAAEDAERERLERAPRRG